MTGLLNSSVYQDSLGQWHSTSCSYFLKTLMLIPPSHWHTTRHLSCPSRTFGDSTEFLWFEHRPTFFSVILPNLIPKASFTSQWPTIPFSPLFCPDNLPFWGKFSLTLLRIHPLSLGFSPFWEIGDLLYVVYHLSHPNTIRMCHLLAFLGDIWI